MKFRSKIALVAIVSASIVATTPNLPVHADTFKPMPSKPSVVINSVAANNAVSGAIGTSRTTIQPSSPVDTSSFITVTATVTTNSELDDIDTVTLCMYKKSSTGIESGVDPESLITGLIAHDSTNPCGPGVSAGNAVEIVLTEQQIDPDTGNGPGSFKILGSPEAAPLISGITGAAQVSGDADTINFVTSGAHGLNIGDRIVLRGFDEAGLNNVHTVTAIPITGAATNFRIARPSGVSGTSFTAASGETREVFGKVTNEHFIPTVSGVGVSRICTNINGVVTPNPASACEYDPSAVAARIWFRFQPSFALFAGTDWNVAVSAQLPDSVCQPSGCAALGAFGFTAESLRGYDIESTVPAVNFYGQINAGATSTNDYGYLIEGQTSNQQTYSGVSYFANGVANLTINGTDFERSTGSTPFDSLDLVITTPSTNEVRLECADARIGLLGGGKYVPEHPSTENLDSDRDPTLETADSGSIDCRLTYGGGADVALQTYSNTVTLALGAA